MILKYVRCSYVSPYVHFYSALYSWTKLNINVHTLQLGVWMVWDELIIGDLIYEANIDYDWRCPFIILSSNMLLVMPSPWLAQKSNNKVTIRPSSPALLLSHCSSSFSIVVNMSMVRFKSPSRTRLPRRQTKTKGNICLKMDESHKRPAAERLKQTEAFAKDFQ